MDTDIIFCDLCGTNHREAGECSWFMALAENADACEVEVEGPPPYDAATATGMYDHDEGG